MPPVIGTKETSTGLAPWNGSGIQNTLMGSHTIYRIQANTYEIRSVTHQGRKHLVVPVVMMVEGVHHGSHGPLLHPISELGKYPEAWNGIPVCISHPEQAGRSVSANSPDIIDRQTVGRVYNTRVDGRKLKAEAWLDEEKLGQVSSTALSYIRNNRPLDVSVGVFTDDDQVEGAWEGETYTAIARNHRPDHLALLPGGVGACSWADGCGVRINKREGGSGNVSKQLVTLKELSKEGYSVLLTDEMSHEDVSHLIQAKLDRMDDDTKFHFLHAVFSDHFIYEVSQRNSGETELYRRFYNMKETDGAVEFTGEAVPVTRKVEYVTMELKRTKFPKGGVNNMGDENKKIPCCPEKVNLLIQSEHSPFEESNREWLEGLDQDTIDKMVVPVANLEAEEDTKGTTEGETKEEKKEEGSVAVNKEDAIKVLQDQLKTPEQFLQVLPAAFRDQMETGLKLHKEKREEMITTISAYSDAYTKEELEGKSMGDLSKLVKMIPSKGDFSVFGAGKATNPVTNEILLPPHVVVDSGK